MFDDDPYLQQTSGLVFSNLLIIFAVFLLLKDSLKNKKINGIKIIVSKSLLFIFVLFSFWCPDWFHYLDGYSGLVNGNEGHMEQIYVWIAQNLSIDYISFRFMIWGISLILFFETSKRLQIRNELSLFFFGTVWIIWFSYARVTLPMAMVYLGMTLFLESLNNKKKLLCLVGGALIFGSFYFHKTSLFAIVTVILAVLSKSLSYKKFIIVCILFISILFFFLDNMLEEFMIIDLDNSEMAGKVGNARHHLIDDENINGLGATFKYTLERLPYYLISFMIIKYELKFGQLLSDSMHVFFNLQLILVICASLFYFDWGISSKILYVRFLRFAAIPSVIALSYLWDNYQNKKLLKFTYVISFTGTIFSLLYSIYLVF